MGWNYRVLGAATAILKSYIFCTCRKAGRRRVRGLQLLTRRIPHESNTPCWNTDATKQHWSRKYLQGFCIVKKIKNQPWPRVKWKQLAWNRSQNHLLELISLVICRTIRNNELMRFVHESCSRNYIQVKENTFKTICKNSNIIRFCFVIIPITIRNNLSRISLGKLRKIAEFVNCSPVLKKSKQSTFEYVIKLSAGIWAERVYVKLT